MSVKVMSWAWDIQLPPTQKLILMAIADHCDDQGCCFPGQDRVAQKCGVSRRTVVRTVSLFERGGLLTVLRRHGGDGGGSRSNYYCVDLSCTELKAVATESDTVSHSPKLAKVTNETSESDKSDSESDIAMSHEPSVEPSVNRKGGRARARRSPKFERPTLQQCIDLAEDKGGHADQGTQFFHYYESNGWRVGKGSMKSLNSAMAGWLLRDRKWEKTHGKRRPSAGDQAAEFHETVKRYAARGLDRGVVREAPGPLWPELESPVDDARDD